MSRRIVHTERVDVQVDIDRETFADIATLKTLGPSSSPRESGGRGQIMIEFGHHTPVDAPWYGDEPTFRFTLDEAKALRAALDACIRISDG